MSKFAIRVSELNKEYLIFSSRWRRTLNAFGLFQNRIKPESLKKALIDISFDIKRGERVAIIGENGAGKSTLLKILSQAIAPTSGTLEITGVVHALLSLEAGLHDEFTGRENVLAYLGQLGLSSNDIQLRLQQIIEFSELIDVMDRPVKTYSQGMAMRLMFSMSIVDSPEILLIDEVLSVGDAYFSQKSMNRIREMVDSDGTTLVVVTHDMQAAAALCDRVIWIEDGRVKFDGDSFTALKRYAMKIRERSEIATRERHLKSTGRAMVPGQIKNGEEVYLQFRTAEGNPLDADLPIERIELLLNGKTIGVCRTQQAWQEDEADVSGGVVTTIESNWSPLTEVDGRSLRLFKKFGSIFHRAPMRIKISQGFSLSETDQIEALVIFKDIARQPCFLELYPDGTGRCAKGMLNNNGGGDWQETRIELSPQILDIHALEGSNRFGTQAISISDFSFHNGDGLPAHLFEIGQDIHFSARYEINDPDFHQAPILLVTFLRDGVHRTHRFVMDNQNFSYQECRSGIINAIACPFLAGAGDYTVNVIAMAENYFDLQEKSQYFTENTLLFDSHSRAYELTVAQADEQPLKNDIMFLHPVKWNLSSCIDKTNN